jgi:ankyrin repeat protein
VLTNMLNFNLTYFRYTALMWAANCGVLQICQLLLDAGAVVDQVDPFYHFTPLILAARHGHTQVVDLLMQRGADVNALAKGCRGNRVTALSLASTKYEEEKRRREDEKRRREEKRRRVDESVVC